MMLVESGDDIIAVDCGLLFPDDEMPGVDYVIPDFSYLGERRQSVQGRGADPRPRGPHRRAVLPPARVRRAGVRHAAHAGARALAARRERRARARGPPVLPARATRSRSACFTDRPDPRHPLRRRRHRTRHRDAGGHGRPHRRLQARPASRWTPSSPTTRSSRARRARRARALLGLDQRRPARAHGIGDRGGRGARRAASRRAPGGSSSPPSPRTSTASSRCWIWPRAAGAASRCSAGAWSATWRSPPSSAT